MSFFGFHQQKQLLGRKKLRFVYWYVNVNWKEEFADVFKKTIYGERYNIERVYFKGGEKYGENRL